MKYELTNNKNDNLLVIMDAYSKVKYDNPKEVKITLPNNIIIDLSWKDLSSGYLLQLFGIEKYDYLIDIYSDIKELFENIIYILRKEGLL